MIITSDGLVQILLAVIGVIGSVLTAVLVPYLNSKIALNKRQEIKFWVKLAVSAAEQTYTDPKAGEDKKQFVIDFLNAKGIDIDESDLNILIEAAVRELNLSADAIKEYE